MGKKNFIILLCFDFPFQLHCHHSFYLNLCLAWNVRDFIYIFAVVSHGYIFCAFYRFCNILTQ